MILDTLADAARERTRARQKKISFAKMRHLAESLPQKRAGCFQKALQAPGLHIIAEVKKASPSKGLIAPFFPYETIAETYEKKRRFCYFCPDGTDSVLGKGCLS